MRVLVTGGAGFIGSHIVDQLMSHGHEPSVVDDLSSGTRENLPSDVPLYEIDIRDAQGLKRVFEDVRPEAVYHQAAQMSVSRSVREPVFDAEVNVLGFLKILDLCARHKTGRVMFASSGGVLYGDVHEPASEDHAADPISPYGISKWVGEKYLQFYARERGLKGVALRYSNVFGPRQNPHGEAGVVAIFSQKMLAAQQVTINGDGSIVRDYVYVGDVARANVLALQADFSDDYLAINIGTGQSTTVDELAGQLHSLCTEARQRAGTMDPVPDPHHGPSRPGDLQSSLISAHLAGEKLDWQPQTSLSDSLRQTVAWFAEQKG